MIDCNTDILLYKELVEFCNCHAQEIDTNFTRNLEFNEFNIECYKKMFYANRRVSPPPAVKELKKIISELPAAYKDAGRYLNPRNKYKKVYDIQLGQWYEKALQLFFLTRGLIITKRGYPYPDLEITDENRDILGFFELKYIGAPFLTANTQIKNTYPYNSTRYDYEASLTLDTGEKLLKQREKSLQLIEQGFPVHYVWWFDCFHIKGIFAMSAQDVFDYYDHVGGDLHVRKEREGDKIDHQELGKIYPPLLEMITFAEYLNLIKSKEN